MPNNREIQLEACRIIFASEVSSPEGDKSAQSDSWLRDLITSSEELTQEARFGPIRSPAESMMSVLQIKGKRSLFDGCPCEAQLEDFIENQKASNLGVFSDQELRNEACKIVARLGKAWGMSPADLVDNWLVNLIGSSTNWLTTFRLRKNLPPCKGSIKMPIELTTGTTFHAEVRESMEDQRIHFRPKGVWPQSPDEGNVGNVETSTCERSLYKPLTLGADSIWSSQLDKAIFRSSSNTSPALLPQDPGPPSPMEVSLPSGLTLNSPLSLAGPQWQRPGSCGPSEDNVTLGNPPSLSMVKRNYAFFNDANFHRWLAQELRRWIAATMSPNNPNCHIPSDQEIQHQARFIVYEE